MKTNKLFQSQSGLAAALAIALLLPASLHAVTVKFTSSGTFTPPAGITSITVEGWGGGGAGGGAQRTTANSGGGGGGGGAYAKKLSIPVTPGTPYTVTIPAAATCPASGWANNQTYDASPVTFTGDGGVSVTANGGTGGKCAIDATGAGGAGGAAGVGYDAAWKGGDGKANTSSNGGPGGGGASDLGSGNDATASSSTAGAAKAGSDADHNGGKGASGKTGAGTGNTDNTAPGGGGGGGKVVTSAGSNKGSSGAKGQIIITYSGATVVKTNNTDDLNLGSSWVGGNAPDSTGIAKWDNTVTSANTTSLGADLTWGSINLANPAGLVTINAGNTLTVGGAIDMSSATADLTLNCGLGLGGPAVWNLAASRTLTLGGIVSGSFNITEQGAGKVVLSAANTYSGATAINGGTLQLGASDVIPNGSGKGDVSVAATCTLDLNSYSDTINGLNGAGIVDNTAASTASTLTVGGNNVDSTFSGVMQNSGSSSTNNLVKTGSGQLTLSGHNTFTGTVNVNAGALNLGTANPLANISGLTIGGAQLGYSANNAVLSAPITLSGNVTVIQNSIGAVLASLNGAIGGTGNLTFATGSATMNGDNKVSLGAASSFVGNVAITTTSSTLANNMTVRLGAVNALPTTAVVTLDGQDGNGSSWCDLDLQGYDQTLAGLRNVTRTSRLQRVYNTNSTAATLTISNTANYTFGGTLGKASGNNFGLTKSGNGTLTLAGINTYTGNTTNNAGRLQGVVGSSCASSTVVLNTATATNSVSITDNTRTWTCAAFNASAAGVLEFDFGAVTPSASVSPLTITGPANFTATPTVSVVSSAPLALGTYPLLTRRSTSGTVPTTAQLTVSPTPSGTPNLIDDGTTLSLVITATGAAVVKDNNADNLDLTSSWVGGVTPTSVDTAVWDNTVTGANTTGLGTDTIWAGIQIKNPGGLVTINAGNTLSLGNALTDIDMSTATQDLTLNCALALAAANTWDVTNSRTLTVAGVVSGSFSVTKLGAGTAILSGANTYSGNTAVNVGSLKLGGAEVIPNGTGNGNVSVGASGQLDLNAFSETINGLSGLGTVDNTAAGTATLLMGDNNAASTFGGVITNTAGTLSLVKIGTNALTLSGANGYSGGTTNSGANGIINANSSSALGTGPFTFAGGRRLVVATGLDVTNAIIIGGNSGLTGRGLVEPGTTAGTATVSGPIQINSGAAAGGQFAAPTAGTILRVSGPITSAVTVNSRIGTVEFSGGGTGYTNLVNGQGIIRVGVPNGIATTALVQIGVSTNGILDLNGFNQSLAGITSGATPANATITNSSPTTAATLTLTGTSTFGGEIKDSGGAGKLNLTVNGGSLTLTGTNTYTGNTTVSNGTLVIAVASIATNSTVTVASGAFLQLDFATTNRVGALVLNGTTQSPGVYNSTTGAPFITGSGSLEVAATGPSGPATLTNSVSGGTLSLSWPAGQGWRLQMQTNSLAVGLFTNWTYITDGTLSSTNITTDSTLPTVFYRLTYP